MATQHGDCDGLPFFILRFFVCTVGKDRETGLV